MKRRICDVVIGMVIMALAFVSMVIVYNGVDYLDVDDILTAVFVATIQLLTALIVGVPMFVGVIEIVNTFKKRPEIETVTDVEIVNKV